MSFITRGSDITGKWVRAAFPVPCCSGTVRMPPRATLWADRNQGFSYFTSSPLNVVCSLLFGEAQRRDLEGAAMKWFCLLANLKIFTAGCCHFVPSGKSRPWLVGSYNHRHHPIQLTQTVVNAWYSGMHPVPEGHIFICLSWAATALELHIKVYW